LKQFNSSGTSRLRTEMNFCRRGVDFVIGIDEAGRGPLAGPVVAAAVSIIDAKARDGKFKYLLANIDDSKKVGAGKRELMYRILINHPAIAWGCGIVGCKKIDEFNILQASKLAMSRAANAAIKNFCLNGKIFLLIDGNFPINAAYSQKSIIGGDGAIFSISAASIIAKAARDRIMLRLDGKYPAYGFARHKGYPTADHLARLKEFGPCAEHRASFAPVSALICKKTTTG
jgi:ribonuclease HII